MGIDEAGRGALAGPVSVGGVLLLKPLTWEDVPGLKDSKKLSERKREYWLSWIEAQARARTLAFSCVFKEAHHIDSEGIVPSCLRAAQEVAHELSLFVPGKKKDIHVLLDAGLSVPPVWSQRSIIRGDETEVAIALASIVAKVTRDNHMRLISEDYPLYQFATHKGYGTDSHRKAIKKHGLTKEHRQLFCRSSL